ncbi:hypothetical protein ACFL3H_07990, partial [Gemmatimonadota bacterium]
MFRVTIPILNAVCLWLIIGLTTSNVAMAQSATGGRSESISPPDVTIYLPQAHPAYGTIERLRSAGLITDAWLNQRPLSRLVIARALLEGSRSARGRGLTMLAQEAEWRLREFARDLEPDGVTVEPGETPLALHWEGDHQASITAEPTVVFAYEARTDIPPDFKSAAITRWGFEMYGTAGPGVGYSARYRESYEDRQGSITRWKYSPDQTVANSLDNFDFDEESLYSESGGHVSWDGSVLGIDLCLDSPAWGPSPGSNLVLSGHAPSFGHMQLRASFGELLRYTMLAGSLSSEIVDSLHSYQPEEETAYRRLYKDKYIFGHRVDINLFSNLTLGLNEIIITGDRSPDFIYIVPTASVWDAQHYLHDPDNVMMSLDVNWSPDKGPRLYGGIA